MVKILSYIFRKIAFQKIFKGDIFLLGKSSIEQEN